MTGRDDQSTRWQNVWLFCIVVALLQLRLGLYGIERAIREMRVEVRVNNGEVQP